MLPKSVSRKVAFELREIYGDPDAAKEAVEQLATEPKVLEAWATKMLRSEPYGEQGRPEGTGRNCQPFSWDEVPPALREGLIRAVAMAYLVSTSKEVAA